MKHLSMSTFSRVAITFLSLASAAQLFAQLLGDNLRLQRRPLAEPGRQVNYVASELESRLGGRVLPEWIDVLDDPTLLSWEGKPLSVFVPDKVPVQ
jgi:hypothetical protein